MRKTLFIGSEVRSGSTYIAESLAYQLDKQFGYSFYDLANEKFAQLNDLSSAAEVMETYNSLFLDKSGWASSKVMCSSLSIITRESRRFEQVHSAFFGEATFWIIIRRRDRVKQAVSLALARKSGIYHYYEISANSPDNDYQIDKKDIQDALRAIELSDTYLKTFTQSLSNEQYIEIFYEDFCENEVKFINRAYQFMGFNGVANADTYVGLAKLQPTATQIKLNYGADFKYWLLENHHPI